MRSDPIKEMKEYMEKCLSIHSFSFYGPGILERKQWIQSKIIGIKRFKLLSKGPVIIYHLGGGGGSGVLGGGSRDF